MILSLNREQLRNRNRRIVRRGTYFKPELSLYEVDGRKIAVKDCSGMRSFLKLLVGRRTQKRETAIYQCLEGVEGVPGFLGIIDEDAFAVEFVEGETLSRQLEKERLASVLENLEKVINSIHARRVVHLDLKQKRNVLVQEDNRVAVVDFQSAIRFRKGPLSNLLFSWLKKRDRAGLIKFKAKYGPELLSSFERKIYSRERILAKLWPFTHLVRGIRKVFHSGS